MKNASNIFILIAVFAIFSSFQVRAQQWLSPEYLQVEEGQAVSFSDIQKAFNNWSAERDLSKTKGWKRYKRWEWFYGQRLDNDGEIPSPSINWLEYYKFENNYPKPKGLKTANWLSLAPTSLPTSPDPYNIYGMGRINCIEFHPTDTNTIFVGASQGGVWKTTDDGQSWACITDNIPVMRISSIAIDPNNPEVIYIATGDIDYIGFPTISQGRITQYGIGILKSTDGGVTWNTTGLSFELTDQDFSLLRKIIVNPNDSNKLLAGGPAGMYRSDDAGISWTKTSSNLYIDIEPNPNNANVIYAATFRDAENPTSQRIYKSTNFGDTWNELTTGITNSVYRVELAAAPSDTSIVYAITTNVSGALHAFYKTIDAGATWVETATEPNVLGWADGGEFSDATGMEDNAGQGDYDLTLIVNPTNANKVYSGGVNMWGSSDGGVVWDLVSMWIRVFGESIHADQHSSAFNPLSGHFYQAGDGGLYKTTDLQIGNLDLTWLVMHGCVTLPPPADADEISDVIVPGCYMLPTTWTYNSNGVHNTEYYRLGTCKSYADMVIGGTQDNGTYLYKDGAWINTLGGDGMEAMIHHDSVNIIWATNYNGALSRSNDGGQSYVSGLEAPITDAGELGDWVTPFVMHPVFADTIYAGFYNVWRSGDRGNTWEKLGDISNSQSLRALAVAPSNSNYIYAARPGGLLVTKNAGVSWEGISLGLPTSTNKITYIAVDAQNPEKVYVCFSGYSNGKKVYMSQNAGEDWINISSNLPNVSANSIVCENIGYQGAIYVGTDIGVYYSNDSIRASDSLNYWISYSEGLPNVVINELEINEAGQKLRAATYGRGLWETDLYVYENAVPEVEDISGIFKVFPNPNNGAFRITGKMIDSEDIKIRVFGLNGSLLFSYAERTNNVDKEIDLSKFANGTYILQIEMNNSHYTSKIVKE